MTRREFPRKLRAVIVLRATDADGIVCCEGCGLRLGKKPYQIDHTLAEEFVTDKSKPLTAEDGRLLGQECCHAPKTANDIRMLRKAERVRDKNSGAFKRKSALSNSRLRKKVNGDVIDRQTGRIL